MQEGNNNPSSEHNGDDDNDLEQNKAASSPSPTERPSLARSDHSPRSILLVSSYQMMVAISETTSSSTPPPSWKEISTKEIIQKCSNHLPLATTLLPMDERCDVDKNAPQDTTVAQDNDNSPKSSNNCYWIDAEIQGSVTEGVTKLNDSLLHPLFALMQEHKSSPAFLQRHLQQASQYQTTQVLPLPQAVFVVMRILQPSFSVRRGDEDEDDARNNSSSKNINTDGKGRRCPCKNVPTRHAAALVLQEGILLTVTSSSHLASLKEQLQHQPSVPTKITLSPKASNDRKEALGSSGNNSSGGSSFSMDDLMMVPEASVTGALVMWLQIHLQRTNRVAHDLRVVVLNLAQQMEQDPTGGDGSGGNIMREIAYCQDKFLHISAVAEEQSECVQALRDADDLCNAVDFTSHHAVRASVTVLLSTASSTERLLSRLEKRLHDMRQAYESSQQDKINHRLNVLTVFSAVFLPLTLMAGIYGMNFSNMPELQRENAYYCFLAGLVTLAGLLLGGFYYRGWFDA